MLEIRFSMTENKTVYICFSLYYWENYRQYSVILSFYTEIGSNKGLKINTLTLKFNEIVGFQTKF